MSDQIEVDTVYAHKDSPDYVVRVYDRCTLRGLLAVQLQVVSSFHSVAGTLFRLLESEFLEQFVKCADQGEPHELELVLGESYLWKRNPAYQHRVVLNEEVVWDKRDAVSVTYQDAGITLLMSKADFMENFVRHSVPSLAQFSEKSDAYVAEIDGIGEEEYDPSLDDHPPIDTPVIEVKRKKFKPHKVALQISGPVQDQTQGVWYTPGNPSPVHGSYVADVHKKFEHKRDFALEVVPNTTKVRRIVCAAKLNWTLTRFMTELAAQHNDPEVSCEFTLLGDCAYLLGISNLPASLQYSTLTEVKCGSVKTIIRTELRVVAGLPEFTIHDVVSN